MRRRDSITLVGGTAWPLAVRAQQTGKLPTIGWIDSARLHRRESSRFSVERRRPARGRP
jgi:hypothetical protein